MRTNTVAITIGSNRACERCGYNLVGQVVGGVCPECGTTIAASDAGPSAALHAPRAYLRLMMFASWGMAIAPAALFILGILYEPLGVAGAAGILACTIVWTTGAILATWPLSSIPWSRTWPRVVARWITIVTQLGWVGIGVLAWIDATIWLTTPTWAIIVAASLSLVGLLGLLALQAPLSDLAAAIGDDDLGIRLRSSMISVVFAMIAINLITVITLVAPILVLLLWVFRYIAGAALLVCGLLMLYHLGSLGMSFRWALGARERESYDRARLLRNTISPSRIRSCACGFDRTDLPTGAACPACGRRAGAVDLPTSSPPTPEAGDIPLAARPDRLDKPIDSKRPSPGAAESARIVRSRTSIRARRRIGEKRLDPDSDTRGPMI